jgi:beta-galactosidase
VKAFRSAIGFLSLVAIAIALFAVPRLRADEADRKTYLRITHWRQTRALSQLLANLGAGFSCDKNSASLTKPEAGYYVPTYRPDFEQGDDPYRYFRW